MTVRDRLYVLAGFALLTALAWAFLAVQPAPREQAWPAQWPAAPTVPVLPTECVQC